MRTNRLILTGIFLLMLIGALACRKDKNNNDDTGRISMRLTDAPADYDAVYIDIQQVEFKMRGRAAIMLTPNRPGMYNVLNFRNGTDTLLVNTTVPVGDIEQVRLILGANNYVVVDGDTYPLTTPSGQQSGVKLNLHTTIEANASYDMWIDFDAGKSVNHTGSGKYQLKPVIRAYSALTNGRIEGYVLPLSAMATVYAINGADTVSAIPAPDGHFVISGLAEGSYQLYIEPAVLTFASFSTNVNVSFGVIANVGTITLL
ncbi:DUF4382 domain-containing protein [Nemorincola caseinilytica]|uniref:DUF4382 domain-containing protein n=1 Tax=Nemorincola caseinilytica TaxID=2054315 RepID=A0ABP8N3U6_9BACT